MNVHKYWRKIKMILFRSFLAFFFLSRWSENSYKFTFKSIIEVEYYGNLYRCPKFSSNSYFFFTYDTDLVQTSCNPNFKNLTYLLKNLSKTNQIYENLNCSSYQKFGAFLRKSQFSRKPEDFETRHSWVYI